MEINVEINIRHTQWTFSNYFCLTIIKGKRTDYETSIIFHLLPILHLHPLASADCRQSCKNKQAVEHQQLVAEPIVRIVLGIPIYQEAYHW